MEMFVKFEISLLISGFAYRVKTNLKICQQHSIFHAHKILAASCRILQKVFLYVREKGKGKQQLERPTQFPLGMS